MDELKFKVRGNEGDYLVSFKRSGNNLTATCTCDAAAYGMHCRHRILLMTGDSSIIISKNKDDIGKLLEMIKEADVEEALKDVLETQKQLEALEKEFSNKKKKLARKMSD